MAEVKITIDEHQVRRITEKWVRDFYGVSSKIPIALTLNANFRIDVSFNDTADVSTTSYVPLFPIEED